MVNEKYWAWSYVAGKYDMAVEVLCTSFAPNWERMKDAIFAFYGLRPEHFPDDDLYVRHLNICDRATKFGPLVIGERQFRGAIEHTLRRSKRSTFEKLANEISALSEEIIQRRGHYTEPEQL